MRAIVLTNDSPSQAALCHKLSRHCEIVAVVHSQNVPRRPPSSVQRAHLLTNRVAAHVFGHRFVQAWKRMQAQYACALPPVSYRTVQVRNVNEQATMTLVQELEPDVLIVSGTNLVGKKLIEVGSRRLGVLNLHTGISPYVKGGPNCTNWCLAEEWFHLIGNSVMWLDPGIDSGPIIATEQTPLDGSESLDELHWKVMEHAHRLYVRAVQLLASGVALPRVAQSTIAEGRTFYTREWTATAMRRAWRNFVRDYCPDYFQRCYPDDSAGLKLVSLPSGPEALGTRRGDPARTC